MMKDFQGLLMWRRSIRKYTAEEILPEDVEKIISAALLAPTSKNKRSWEFTVIDDKELLLQMAQCKPQFARPIASCSMAVVVSANPIESDVWIEDAAIAASYMQLQAEALGLGSCWIQVRNRFLDTENTSSEYLKELLNISPEQQVLCVLSMGHKAESKKSADPAKLRWDKVHLGRWK